MHSSGGLGWILTSKSSRGRAKTGLNPAARRTVTFAALPALVTGATRPEGDTVLDAF
jgi:hypothetical protein